MKRFSYHGFVDGISCLVGKDAGGEARDDLFDSEIVAGVEDVVVHEHVVPEEVQVGPQVVEQSANLKNINVTDPSQFIA